MHAMTAAHRTLPLGSIVRVVNVQTKASAIVRITDRGPFIEGRVVDLSKAAAEKIGMLQKGTTQVRVEVLKTPVPIEMAAAGPSKLAASITSRLRAKWPDTLPAAINRPRC